MVLSNFILVVYSLMDGDLLADWLAVGGALLQSLHALGVDPGCWTSVQRSLPTDVTES